MRGGCWCRDGGVLVLLILVFFCLGSLEVGARISVLLCCMVANIQWELLMCMGMIIGYSMSGIDFSLSMVRL